jgi:hypothetical protein
MRLGSHRLVCRLVGPVLYSRAPIHLCPKYVYRRAPTHVLEELVFVKYFGDLRSLWTRRLWTGDRRPPITGRGSLRQGFRFGWLAGWRREGGGVGRGGGCEGRFIGLKGLKRAACDADDEAREACATHLLSCSVLFRCCCSSGRIFLEGGYGAAARGALGQEVRRKASKGL